MKTFKIFCNSNTKSQDVKWRLQLNLARAGFLPATEGSIPDVCIAVGGDGAFLRMVRECGFNPNIKFVGINTGTLGFLQELKTNEVEYLVNCLSSDNFSIQKLSYLKCEIESSGNKKQHKCLNEIIIRDQNLQVLKLEIRVNGTVLERFIGDGISVCTSVGSTAYNMALGGALVPFDIDTLQLTPVAQIYSNAYRSLKNSVILHKTSIIDVIPEKKSGNIIACVDGVNEIFENFEKLQITLSELHINYIKINAYTFWDKINEKFSNIPHQ